MRRMSGFLVRRSRAVLLVTAALTVLAASQFTRAGLDADVSGILLEGRRGHQMVEHRQRFESGDPITVVVRLGAGRFTDKQPLKALLGFRDQLAAVPGVASVTSLLPAHNPLTDEPVTAEFIEQLPDWLLTRLLDTSVAHLFVDHAGQNTLLLVIPSDDADPLALVDTLAAVPRPDGFEVKLAGASVIVGAMSEALGWPVLIMPLCVLLLLCGTFYLSLRSGRATLLALLPAVVGTVWSFGLIFGLGFELNLLTLGLPLFVLVMGSADGLHLVAFLQRETLEGVDNQNRIDHALEQVGVPMVLTTLSTAIGFGSLMLTDIRPVRELGGFVAAGLVFAGLVSWFSLPALLTHIDLPARARKGPTSVGVGRRLLRLAGHRWLAAGLAALVLVASAVYIPRLRVDADPLFFFDEDEPIREGFARMTAMFGGGTPMTGEFAFDPATAPEPQFKRMRALSRQFEQLPGVEAVFSLADVASFLPDSMIRAALRGEAVAGLGKLASTESVLFLLLPDQHTRATLHRWLAFADSHEDIVLLTGITVLVDELSSRVLTGLSRSLLTALLLIVLLLAVAYRSQWDIVVALVPLTLTTGALLSFAAASGMHVNLVTVVIAGIAIGVAIDYAIHLIAAIHHERPLGDGYVGRALEQTGMPILANALSIALAMSALFLPAIRPPGQIAAIMWVTMSVGALAALVIIPACYPRHAVLAPSAPDAGEGESST